MAMTSAAEAKLDARIRPDITALRSRTSYPRRRPAATAVAETQVRGVTTMPRAGEAAAAPGFQAPPAASRRTPVRLTRRGRIVVGTLAVIGVAAAVSAIWLAVAGQAQASGHARPAAPLGNSMLRVVVRPGQTLWWIAAHADPNADPRATISEIMDTNSLTGTTIEAGQVLWVPKG
jgi:hypothetical protein